MHYRNCLNAAVLTTGKRMYFVLTQAKYNFRFFTKKKFGKRACIEGKKIRWAGTRWRRWTPGARWSRRWGPPRGRGPRRQAAGGGIGEEEIQSKFARKINGISRDTLSIMVFCSTEFWYCRKSKSTKQMFAGRDVLVCIFSGVAIIFQGSSTYLQRKPKIETSYPPME